MDSWLETIIAPHRPQQEATKPGMILLYEGGKGGKEGGKRRKRKGEEKKGGEKGGERKEGILKDVQKLFIVNVGTHEYQS